MKMDNNKSPTSYYKRFINGLEVLESQFGPLIPEAVIERMEDYELLDEADLELERETAKNKFAALTYLQRASRKKYGKFLTELNNDYLKGSSKFPDNIEEALEMLVQYQQNAQSPTQRKQGAAFAQKKKVTCYNCGKEGHIKSNCPDLLRNESREQAHVSQETENNQQQQQ